GAREIARQCGGRIVARSRQCRGRRLGQGGRVPRRLYRDQCPTAGRGIAHRSGPGRVSERGGSDGVDGDKPGADHPPLEFMEGEGAWPERLSADSSIRVTAVLWRGTGVQLGSLLW